MTTRAVIYCRISEDRDDDSLAVDRQEEDCRKLAEREGWEVTRVYRETASASSRKGRKVYRQLVADLEAGAFDVIVVWAQDRLVRKVDEMIELIEKIEKRGSVIPIVTVQAGRVDLSTPGGQTLALLASVIARGEVMEKAGRQRRQQRQAAEKGESASRRAFGYRCQDGRWIVDQDEAEVVKEAFERLLSRGHSVSEITAWINTKGLVTAAQGKPWNRRGVRCLLLSARYCGIREYRKGREDALTVTSGRWPTLISVEDHEKAVKLLTDPVRTTTTGNARKHLGSGLFHCGCAICQGQETVKVVTRRNGRLAYTCRTFHLAMSTDPTDATVLGVVEGYLARPDGPARLMAAKGDPEVSSLIAERDEHEARIARAKRDYDGELIDASDLKEVKTSRQAKIDVLNRKIAVATRTSQLAQVANAPDPVAAFQGLGLSLRQEIIASLLTVTLLPAKSSSPIFDPSRVKIDWR